MRRMRAGIILAGLAIAILNNLGAGVEVSSKIDFDSDENDEILEKDSTFGANSKNPASPELILHAPKPSAFNWRGSELVKASEPRKRRIYPSHDNSVKEPKIINNIQVVVNSNDSISDSCEHGICNVSVSSKVDEKGNIVTEIHLSITTKAKPNVKIDDVPVISGFQGASKDKQPILHSINSPRSMHTQFHRDNIPQIQTDYRRHGEPWHGRIFQRPQIYWNYQLGDYGNIGFRSHNTWQRDRPIVDDKIEPPLSKTKPSDDINF
ncbi:hypothetical protein PUN28_004933 [Cardiocondyla obscurior]